MVSCLILMSLFITIVLMARQIQHENIASHSNRPSISIAKTNPVILQLLAGDFKGIISDYLVLQTSQFIGEAEQNIPNEDLEALAHLLGKAQQLDPYFFTIPYYAEGSLAKNSFIVKKINTILQTSDKHRKWDWEPGFYLGFNYFYYLNQTKKASDVLQQASLRPDAPIILGFLAAKFRNQSGQTAAAIRLLEIMRQTTKNKQSRTEIAKRLKGYQGILILEKKIDEYYKKFKHFPSKLNDLIKSGIIKQLPKNPYYQHFWYKPENGEVSFFPFEQTGHRQ